MATIKTTRNYVILFLALLALVCGLALAASPERESALAFAGALLDDDATAGTINLAASSAQYTLPAAYDPYIICAHVNRAYVLCGANPTAAATAGSYTFSVPAGACLGPIRLTGPKCAHIAASAAGQIEFLHINTNLHY